MIRRKKRFNNKFTYPCIERMKLSYIYILFAFISLFPSIHVFRENSHDFYMVMKVIMVAVLCFCLCCVIMNITLVYMDLLFMRRLSFNLSQKICSITKAWELIYNKGMKIHPYVLNQPLIFMLITKMMYEYNNMYNNEDIKRNLDSILPTLEASGQLKEIDITQSPLSEIAEKTFNHLNAPTNKAAMVFYMASSSHAQSIFIILCFIVFGCFMIMQLLKLMNLI